MRIKRLLPLVVLLMLSVSTFAHHGTGVSYDASKPLSMTGVVTEFEWVNPHTWLHVTVDDGKGGKVEWLAEGRAPGILLRAGWTKSSLKFGETVTVDMSPAKNGTRKAIIARITKADGTILSNQPVLE